MAPILPFAPRSPGDHHTEGRTVVATDLRTPATEKAAAELAGRIDVRWADLTDADAATSLVTDVQPSAVLHLAAVIPPATYVLPQLARAVNVGATETLLRAVGLLPSPCRFVLASSVAVYGSRNPHTTAPPVTAGTPVSPREQCGAHKVAAEALVRESDLDWAILRIGVVVFDDMSLAMDPVSMRLEALLPTDGRLHAVDGRDVAAAFAHAVDAGCSHRTLLVAGDASTRMTQRDLARSMTGAVGLAGSLPQGRTGDPADDDSWFNVDWMDTAEAQEVLDFQRHSWTETLQDVAASIGRTRHVLPVVAPVERMFLALRSPYRGVAARPADPWGGIAREWGPDALA